MLLHRAASDVGFREVGRAAGDPGYTQGRRHRNEEKDDGIAQPSLLASGSASDCHLDERIGESHAVAGSPQQHIVARHAE